MAVLCFGGFFWVDGFLSSPAPPPVSLPSLLFKWHHIPAQKFLPMQPVQWDVKFTLADSKVQKRRNLGVENGHLLHFCITVTKFKFKKVQAMRPPSYRGLRNITCCICLQLSDTLLLKASFSSQALMQPVKKLAGLSANTPFILFPPPIL